MKRILKLLTVVLALAAGGLYALQRFDLAGTIDGDTTIAPALRANSAATGKWIDIANYSGAMLAITTGNVEAAVYVVLQDSSSGLAVQTVDSVVIAAANDTTYVELRYNGSRRYIRGLQRATAAGDTVNSGVLVLRGGRRSR